MADPTNLSEALQQFRARGLSAIVDRGDTLGATSLTSPSGESAVLSTLPAMLGELQAGEAALAGRSTDRGPLSISRVRLMRP